MKYRTMAAESGRRKEKDDCAVIAVAMALNVSYEKAHRMCAELGRPDGKGMTTAALIILFKRELNLSEIKPADMIARYPKAHRILKSVTTHHPERFNKVWRDGRYILFCNGHVAYVDNGVTHDWTRGRAKRVWKIYEIKGDKI